MALSLLPLHWAHCPLKTPGQRVKVQEVLVGHDCLQLAPVSVNVEDSLTHLMRGATPSLFLRAEVKCDNPRIIPNKAAGRKSHHVLSPAVLCAPPSGSFFPTLGCNGSTEPLETI